MEYIPLCYSCVNWEHCSEYYGDEFLCGVVEDVRMKKACRSYLNDNIEEKKKPSEAPRA